MTAITSDGPSVAGAGPLDERHGEASEVVVLDELVQVDGQQLKGDAQVTAEVEVLGHVDDVAAVLHILQGAAVLRQALQTTGSLMLQLRSPSGRLSKGL